MTPFEQTLAFLTRVFSGVHEVRILGGANVVAGRFSDPLKATEAIHAFTETYRGVYVTLNPCKLPATDKLTATKQTVEDKDISAPLWLFVDIDPERESGFKGYCATDEERGYAVSLATEIRDYLDSKGFYDPLEVDSGSGRYLIYPVSGLTDREPIRDVLYHLATQFASHEGASVDKAVHNLSRIVRVPGTWNRKGPDTPDRPHRLASIGALPEKDEATPHSKLTALVVAPVAQEIGREPAEAPVAVQPDNPRWPPMGVRAQRCREYVAKLPGAVSGEHGHDKTLRVARLIANDFALDKVHGFPILESYNARCKPQWSRAQIERKWNAGSVASKQYPRGCKTGETASYDDPHKLARAFIRKHPVRYYNDSMYLYVGTHYEKLAKADVESKVNLFIHGEFDKQFVKMNRVATQEYERARANGHNPEWKAPKQPKVTTFHVSNVISALRGYTLIPSSYANPCWLPNGNRSQSIAFTNGILDLDTRVLIPHSSDWFSTVCLPYPYLLSANCPQWLSVLNTSLPDIQLQEVIQMWFGYLLCSEQAQVGLFFHGKGANGKSVILTVMRAFIGERNTSSVRLEEFSRPFSLSKMIGKLLNVCPEVNDIDSADEGRIKAIISGDVVDVEEKFKQGYSTKLQIRLCIATNNVPRFLDRSDGMTRRCIIIPFLHKIPEGQQDRRLTEELHWRVELPGIFLWALEGLNKLRQRRFTFPRPRATREAMRDHQLLSNPAMRFLLETFIEEKDARLLCGDVYRVYRNWCVDNGIKFPLTESMFGKEVKSSFPDTMRKSIRHAGKITSAYFGIRERTENDELETRPINDEPETPSVCGSRNPECSGFEKDWFTEIFNRFID